MVERRNWLNRKEAAAYISERGIKISVQTLANMASNGNAGHGPAFTRFRWKSIQYARVDLDDWIARERKRVE
jgi:hypothetical protein